MSRALLDKKRPACFLSIKFVSCDLQINVFFHFLLQVPHLPQRLLGNGVSQEETPLQVKNWRHNVAEDVSQTLTNAWTRTLQKQKQFSCNFVLCFCEGPLAFGGGVKKRGHMPWCHLLWFTWLCVPLHWKIIYSREHHTAGLLTLELSFCVTDICSWPQEKRLWPHRGDQQKTLPRRPAGAHFLTLSPVTLTDTPASLSSSSFILSSLHSPHDFILFSLIKLLDRHKLKRNLSNRSTGSHQLHVGLGPWWSRSLCCLCFCGDGVSCPGNVFLKICSTDGKSN